MSAAPPVEQYSLLWPGGCDPHTDPQRQRWGEFTQADLGIQTLAEYISSDPQHSASILSFLLALTTDSEVIRYRQEVLEDCLQLPDVLKTLESLQPALAEMNRLGGPLPAEQTPLHKTLNRMSELEIYVQCVHTLGEALSARRGQLHSSGLLRLLDFLAAMQSRPVFRQMLKELPELRARYDTIAGISIGVNLDDGLHPVEATILSIHNKPFRQGTFLGKLFGRGSPEDTAGITPLHVLPFKTISTGMYPVVSDTIRESQELHPLFADLDRLLRETTRPVAQALTQYLQINTRPLALLADEVLFYINGLRLMHRLSAAGLPVCRPEIIPMEERACELDDFYNVNLASDLASAAEGADLRQTVVCNTIRFGAEGRIFILTGPNRGGKTVYTQAVGLAQVLFQAGLFVPGSRARISPVDGIFSHFPVEERPNLDAGRLGEEAGRIEKIFRHITRHSLVLLNESLSTTSPGECLYLARDVVRAFRKLGVRAIFATHLHELGDVAVINQDTTGDSLVASLVSGSEHLVAENGGEESVRRTFQIKPGPPQGISFARDIARKYGIELGQLLAAMQERKVL
jgi:DNA mismatch repair ATPase MutS